MMNMLKSSSFIYWVRVHSTNFLKKFSLGVLVKRMTHLQISTQDQDTGLTETKHSQYKKLKSLLNNKNSMGHWIHYENVQQVLYSPRLVREHRR